MALLELLPFLILTFQRMNNNAPDSPDIYIDIDFNKPLATICADGMSPEAQETLDRLWASLHTTQRASNVRRDLLGQSCVVSPIVRMDKVMGEVVERAARRVAREIVKEQCAYELNLLVATEFYRHGDKKKAIAYGEEFIDQMIDEGMKAAIKK